MRCSWLVILLLGCGEDICIRDSDCAVGEVCMAEGTCAGKAVADDAGVSDAEPDAIEAELAETTIEAKLTVDGDE